MLKFWSLSENLNNLDLATFTNYVYILLICVSQIIFGIIVLKYWYCTYQQISTLYQ